MANRNQSDYWERHNVSIEEELYDGKDNVKRKLYAWIAKVDGTKTVIRTAWLEKFLVHNQRPSCFGRLAAKLGLRKDTYTNHNTYMEPFAQYLKEHRENVPDRILNLLTGYPELVLILLAALFPTVLNIPLFKMFMARKLGG